MMKKTIIKTAIYSFIISFMLLILSSPKTKNVKDVNGIFSTVEVSFRENIFNTLIYSLIITIILVVVTFLVKKFKKKVI